MALAIAAGLALSAAVAILVVRAEEAERRYIAAFDRLADDVARIERESAGSAGGSTATAALARQAYEDLAGSGRARFAAAIALGVTVAGVLGAVAAVAAVCRPMVRAIEARQASLDAERAAMAAEDLARRNFLSVASHELRTPMNGILGFATLLLNAGLKPEHRKQVEIIHASGKTLLALVNDILDCARIEAGSLDLAREEFSIEQAVCEVVTLLRGAASAKGLEFGIFIDPELPAMMLGDSNRLRQVLTNLAGNAIKFTDRGGIAIKVHRVSGSRGQSADWEIELAVIDTGIGIPPDKHELVFERFTQIDTSARRRLEGSGLGLAICRELVNRMGGRIWIESAPGIGSTFFVRLPFEVPGPLAGGDGRLGPAAEHLAGHRVLIVDGDTLSRRIARLQLEAFGLRADEAGGPRDAIGLLEQAGEARQGYAAVIIDEMGPSSAEGLELARRLRADPRLAGLPLILNVGAGTRGADRAEDIGVDAVHAKPVLPRELIETLRRLARDPVRCQPSDGGPDGGPGSGGARPESPNGGALPDPASGARTTAA